MPRLLFEKTGNAVWMSHLDLMRLFQRAFKRAGLNLKHTQGFNPRPSVSIALPLSVGVQSQCELLDFDLEGQTLGCDAICEKLNCALVDGVRVLEVYENGRKIRDLALMDCCVDLEYDRGVDEAVAQHIAALFQQSRLEVEKKSKNGVTQQDIIPMIRSLQVNREDGNTLRIFARICCQNPTLNPMQLSSAVELYLPEWKPDFVKCRRLEVYDGNGTVFR